MTVVSFRRYSSISRERCSSWRESILVNSAGLGFKQQGLQAPDVRLRAPGLPASPCTRQAGSPVRTRIQRPSKNTFWEHNFFFLIFPLCANITFYLCARVNVLFRTSTPSKPVSPITEFSIMSAYVNLKILKDGPISIMVEFSTKLLLTSGIIIQR